MAHVILRLPDVKKRTGLSRSSIYLRMTKKAFPASVSLGGRAVGWLEDDIELWLDQKIQSSRAGGSCRSV